ncbi:N-formylglutamate amidohydrolase [Profundibacterium mesophilum]|uniref:Formiminoglutamase n=1 Tax=Profundibacterium mesophilum KAUST100406-0324 TaxID=1037889 RepID=A0A921NTQ5_9RHOB|nr:N-formylglutamate amidohydrolase [Profundibacterium mesophilum]KAF0676444.1 formiminoglutamase [Profundibacterium mesophilum KAUST100406-0324]
MSYQPFFIEGADRPSQWLVTCDHAANTVPQAVNGGTLGLEEADMNRHIAYDVGAAGLAAELARRLDAPFIRTNFSRLVIDPNRGEDDPTLLMKLYDGTIVPANRHAGAEELERRMELCHRPYHAALEELAARRDDRAILAIHSFTPQLRAGPPRPWKVAVLSGPDRRIADPLVRGLADLGTFEVGDNEPYSGHLPGDSIDRHALAHGRLNILVELRNDLIGTTAAQRDWADTLAPILDAALAEAQL